MKKIFLTFSVFISLAFADNQFINHYVFTWGEKNPQIVEAYLKKAIQSNGPIKIPVAAYILGNLYLSGTFLKKDLKKADRYITMAANLGLPEAINSIGDGYYSGDIREKDLGKALYYYKKAAKAGFGPAQFNAGVVFLYYCTKEKNALSKAIFYLRLASKNKKDLKDITKIANRYKTYAEHKYRYYYKN